MSKSWKQERPEFCPHPDCVFKRRVMDAMCIGKLPSSEEHDGDFNTHRLCLNGVLAGGEVFDLQVNKTDVSWFKWLFETLEAEDATPSS